MNDVNVEELEVRSLQVKDLKKVAKIIGKCFDKLLKASEESGIGLKEFEEKAKEIKAAKKPEKEKESEKDFEVFGMQLFNIIYEAAESDIIPFIASFINKTAEEFDVMSYKTPLIIIEKLAEKEDLVAFFQRAMKLVKMFRSSGKKQTS